MAQNPLECPVVLDLNPGIGRNEITLYVSQSHSAELLDELEKAGLKVGQPREFAASPTLEPLLIAIGTPAAWLTIGIVLRAFFKRHANKRVEFNARNGKVVASGYSGRDVDRILEKAREVQQQHIETCDRLGISDDD